jgi:hypothetical protein
VLHGEERRIETLLDSAPPIGDLCRLRVKTIYYWAVTALLTFSGLALTLVTLAPFRLGWMSWVFAMGIAVVTPFLVEKALEGRQTLVMILTFVATPAAIASLMFLADVRGNLFDQQLRQNQAQAFVIDDVQPSPEPENTFYDKSTRSLHLALLLLAFGMEVGAGLALREAWRSVPDTSEDWKGLRRELADIRQRKAGIVRVVVDLRNQPGIFAARFWRDFYRAMLSNAVRKSLTRLLLLFIGISPIAFPGARAQGRKDMVIAIDLTASVATAGPDGKSDYQKNVDGVTRLLADVPADSRVTVIGITDLSFAQPYILLSARIGADPGYFGERLVAARNQLVRLWRFKSSHLAPSFHRTDILGALELASQIFAEQSDSAQKILVVFSDMRETAIDLTTKGKVPSISAIAQRCELPHLQGVHVYIMGVDGAGKTRAYWESLRGFWQDYFVQSSADLNAYSALREWQLAIGSPSRIGNGK